MPSFTGETLTETGLLKPNIDNPNAVINPDDPKLGFGHLITNDGGKAINSTSPFSDPPNPISGLDVKWVHGDRWQELQGKMTENVSDDFTTTIGPAPTVKNKDKTTGAVTDLSYPFPPATSSDNSVTGQSDLFGLDGQGGYPISSSDEANIPDPAHDGLFTFPKYTLNVRGDHHTNVGGDMGLWISGYTNTVQIGQYKASFFSQYITNTGDSQYHNTPDSYIELNNDFKKVDNEKYRNVALKVDIAEMALSSQLIHLGGTIISVNGWLAHIGLGILKSKTWALQDALHTEVQVKPKVNAAPSVDAVGSHI